MERFTFTQTAKGIAASDTVKRAFGEHYLRHVGTLPYELVHAAGTDLVAEARELVFKTGKSYEDCAKHLMSQNPWFRVATAAIAANPDSAARALGIEIVGGDRA